MTPPDRPPKTDREHALDLVKKASYRYDPENDLCCFTLRDLQEVVKKHYLLREPPDKEWCLAFMKEVGGITTTLWGAWKLRETKPTFWRGVFRR
jgi:hypothetical protein